MNKLIIVTFFLFSCNVNTESLRETKVYLHNGSGWSQSITTLTCDSAKMLSKSEAIYWVNGFESKVYADFVTIGR